MPSPPRQSPTSADDASLKAAEVALKRGDVMAACGHFAEVVSALPASLAAEHAPLLAGYAGALISTRRYVEALELAMRATIADAKNAEGWTNLGTARHALGQTIDAVAAYRRGLAIDAAHQVCRRNLAAALETLGDFAAATDEFTALLEAGDATPGIRAGLGRCLFRLGKTAEAIAHLESACDAGDATADTWNILGMALRRVGRRSEAVCAYRKATTLDVNSVAAHTNLARACKELGMLDAAVHAAQTARRLDPSSPEATNNLASAMRSQGRAAEAEVLFNAAAVASGDPRPASNRLCSAQYVDGVTPERLLSLHRDWAGRFAGSENAVILSNDLNPYRRLRLGFVSADLHRHPVGLLLLSSLSALDPEQVEIVVYSDSGIIDGVTKQLQERADVWRSTAGVSDGQLTRAIRRDRVDVLFDLAGHTDGNRLPVFADRAAPVQATWLGYVGTTGVPAMDALIADHHHVPIGEEKHYTEKVVRLDGGYVCFRPGGFPEVLPRQTDASRPFTFAAFCNPAKVSPAAVKLWSQVLHAVDGSRLSLKYFGVNTAGCKLHLKRQFRAAGVEPERLSFLGPEDWAAHMTAYQNVDLTLDSMPYSSGLTACESMWMGVPVVTLPGETFAGRHARSHVTQGGFSQFVARNEHEFVAIAKRWANDPAGLSRLRRTARDTMRRSPLCDADAFATSFHSVVRDLWHDHIAERTGLRPTPVMSLRRSA